MSARHEILATVWTDETAEIGGLTVQRPTIHRMNVLLRRRNKWMADDPREQTDMEALAEWLFVLSRTKEELQRMFRVELAEWEEIVDAFLAETPDETIEGFQVYFEGIMDALRAGAVEPEGKPNPEAEPSHAS